MANAVSSEMNFCANGSRPWQYKVRHRLNVVRAFVFRDIDQGSLLLGLLEPHAVKHLPLHRKHQKSELLIVCPDLAREVARWKADGPDDHSGPVV